jgi:hypothetical protein
VYAYVNEYVNVNEHEVDGDRERQQAAPAGREQASAGRSQ